MQKKSRGHWKCKGGCNCADWRVKAFSNDYCVSVGDCGVQTNPAGKVTQRGFYVSVSSGERIPGFLGSDSSSYITGQIIGIDGSLKL